MLTSVQNERVRAAAALARRDARSKTGRFLLEGPQSVSEALAHHPELLEQVFVVSEASARVARLAADLAHAGVRTEQVTPQVLRAIADTVTPQGVVAVARQHPIALEDALGSRPRLIAVLHRISDPGNAGTVLRVADAAGADAVIFTAGSVDPYNPKVVRATTGSIFHVPVVVGADLSEVVRLAHERNLQILAADVGGDDLVTAQSNDDVLSAPTAWVFGNEAHGLTDEERLLVDRSIRLPIFGQAESLNLATAASILLYQSALKLYESSAPRSL